MHSNSVTINDIADRAGVSKSTVSRVLNSSSPVHEDKRKAVMEAMSTLGYQPNVFARSLAGGRSMTVGVVTQSVGSPFYDGIARGVVCGFGGTGYSPLFGNGQWRRDLEGEVIRALLGRRVDGLVLVGGYVSPEDLDELRKKTPTIVVGRHLPGWDNQSIYIDNVDGGYVATRHLIENGHRDIAIFKGNADHPDAIDRYEGYCKALDEAGIELKRDLVYQGDFQSQSGVLAVESLLSKGTHFTAIFAANDMVAFGARLALFRRGIRVPEEVSIVGFDDQPEAALMTPPITSMRQPGFELGEAAAKALTALMNDEPFEIPHMPAELKIRESVARIT